LTIPIKEKRNFGTALAHLGSPLAGQQGITEYVGVTTIDNFMHANGVDRCDFIKCDVEGAEFLVLKGAANAISRCKPTILLEIVADFLSRTGHTTDDVEDFLTGHGYRFYVWNDGAMHPIARLANGRNNFAVHGSRAAIMPAE
jgi:hypothetical protein